MLTLANVSKTFAGRTLFEAVSVSVLRGDRLALVGANGAGKSTLFSIILGEEPADDGTVEWQRGVTLGFLPQEAADVGNETVLDLAMSISPEHKRTLEALRACELAGDHDSEKYHDALAHFSELDGYRLEPAAKRILAGLAFRESDFVKPLSSLSGGWIMRAHLARLLVMQPDLLMLDEPTNHLDLESLGWFQNYLKSYPGSIVVISHDRAFLNELVGGVLEIRNRRVHRYHGNYDDFLVQREERAAQHEAAYVNQQKEIQRLQEFADRFRAKASKASQAQSKLRQIDRMEKIAAPEAAERTVSIRFPQPGRSGRKVITLKDVDFAYGSLQVYRDLNFEAERGDRTVLVGPNGAGKSTLLKLLGGILQPQSGIREPGHEVKVGYYSQNRIDMLDPKRTVLDEAMSIEHPAPEQMARTVLGSFLFPGEDVFKSVAVLSGGEKSRLALVKLLLDPPNLLLMDEPTTHLDMASIEALIEALRQFEGTLVFISHDVYFIKSLAKSTVHISAGQLTRYAGGYEYYLEKSQAGGEREALTAGEQLTDSRPEESRNQADKKQSVFKSKEQKRREAQERQARSNARREAEKRVARLEQEIQQLEERQRELTERLEDPEIYKDGGKVMDLNRQLVAIGEKLEALTADWEKATGELETAAA